MKSIVIVLSFLCLVRVVAQNDTITSTLSFNKTPIKEALLEIEKSSGYRFYYVAEWLEGKQVSGQYKNIPISELLPLIFDKTPLNFFFLKEKKIALSRNNIIYGKLPDGFFGTILDPEAVGPKKAVRDNTPVFYYDDNLRADEEIETVRIGKENDDGQNYYTLEGYVKNVVSGEPIPNLSIVVKNKSIGTSTDNSGFYKIRLPMGYNQIETSSLGIQSVTKNVVIYNNGKLDFDLSESFEQLDEVIIAADAEKNIDDTTTGSTQIGSEETKNIPLVLGERNILKIATTLPGISTAGEGSAGFNVRGGAADQNLVLLDEAVLYNPAHFFGIFQALNPYTTDQLTVYKGNIPAEYGGRLSSVFEITTKDGNVNKFKGEASIGPVTNNIALEIPVVKEKSSIILGGRGTYSDWILRSLDEEALENSKASFYDFIAKYHHKVNENNEIRATGYYSRDAFSITSDSLYNYSNRLFSLKWDYKINEKHTGALALTNSMYNFNIDYNGDTNTDFLFAYKVNESALKLKMRYLYKKAHKINYGLAVKQYHVKPGNIGPNGAGSIVGSFSIPKERALESALFLSDNFKINDKLQIDLGLRYSLYFALGRSSQNVYQEGLPKNEETLVETREFGQNEIVKTYSGPEFRFSGRYYLAPDFSAKASYNSTYQYIHTLSNNTTVSPIDTWKLSDLNIKPQRANQYAVGLYKNFNENRYELSLEGYFKKTKNNLDFKVGAELLLNENIETEVLQGEGKAYGLEFLIRKNEGKVNGWLGYTYSRSFLKLDSRFSEEVVNNGNYFPSNFDKPHDFSLVLNYKFTRRFSLSSNFVYQTGRPVTYPLGSYIYNGAEYAYYSDRNKFRIPDYYRLDLSFNVEGNHKLKKLAHSFWNISIYNVLGRNNPYSVFFVTENGKIQAYKSSIFSIPIPTITYNFKF